jgi:hypothetical protein
MSGRSWLLIHFRPGEFDSFGLSLRIGGNEGIKLARAHGHRLADDVTSTLARLRDVEPALFDVMTLLNAASLMRGNHR